MMTVLVLALFANGAQANLPGVPLSWVPSLLGLTPGEATFASARARLGGAPVHLTSEHAEMCYVAAKGSDGTAVLIESVADYQRLGITGIRLMAKAPRSAQCKRSSGVTLRLAFSNGLRLRMSSAAVRRLLGSPEKIEGRTFEWFREYDVPESPGLRGVARIVIQFDPRDRVEEVEVSRVETY